MSRFLHGTGILLYMLLLGHCICGQNMDKSTSVMQTVFGSIPRDVFEAADDLLPPVDSPQSGQLNITVAMQLSILSASVHNVAWLLLDFDDVRALGLGFKFPPEKIPELIRATSQRNLDPDVVAIRGLATAALASSDYLKLADVFIVSIYGLKFYDQECVPGFVLEYDQYSIPNCHSAEYLASLREGLIDSFSDQSEMLSILNTQPPLVTHGRRRSLLVNNGEPVNSATCAYCFKAEFCGEHVFWCPPVKTEDKKKDEEDKKKEDKNKKKESTKTSTNKKQEDTSG